MTFSLRHSHNDTPDTAQDSSIARLGLLHPPILHESSASSFFQIVSGRKRLLAAARLLGENSSNCLVLPPEVDACTCLAIACEDAMLSCGLSPVERAVFLKKAVEIAGEQNAISQFLPIIGLPSQSWQLEQSIALLELEEPLLDALHERRLDENAARELVRLTFSDRMAIFELIDSLALSVSHQRKLISLCRDLSKRSRQSILLILGSPPVQEIVNHPQANIPQKAANLMRWFTTKAFPRYTEALANHEQLCRNLQLPNNVTLSHACSFEKDSLTLSILFKGWDELSSVWPGIRMIITGEGNKTASSQ